MTVAQGSNAKLRMYPETTYGTFPTSVNFHQSPFLSFEMAAVQEMQKDDVLSSVANRDSADPFFNNIRVEGNVVVPVETIHIGRWLRLLLGAPSTSGSTNYTHVFSSGALALPSNGIEIAHADLSTALYMKLAGVTANSLDVSLTPEGGATARFGLMGLTQTKATSSGAGTPVVTASSRFSNALGTITRDSSTLSGVTDFSFTFSNESEMVDAIRGDFRREDVDLGLATANGRFTIRFKDATEMDAAVATQTPAAITMDWTIDANTSLLFRFARAFITPAGRPINGPRGISQAFTFNTGPHASTGIMTATLKNQTASYATV